MLDKDLETRILRTNEWGLLAILNEGLIDKFKESIESIGNKDYELTAELVCLTKDILTELIIFFNKDSELARNFREIYLYINKLITRGLNDRDKKCFEDAIEIVAPLIEGFNEKELNEDASVVTGLTYGKSDLAEYNKDSGFNFKG